MKEEFGYEVTPEQSLDGLWKTMLKYQKHHGISDISLEMEGSQYEFRHHLKKYEEYKEKAQFYDAVKENVKLAKNLHDTLVTHTKGENKYVNGQSDTLKRVINLIEEVERDSQ